MAGSRFFRNNTDWNIGMRKAAFGSTDSKCLKINFSYHYNLLLYTKFALFFNLQFTTV